jgi:hypothetical protein
MPLRRLPRAAVACALALSAAGLVACGEDEPGFDEPAREGLAIELAGVKYNVLITRQLNIRDAEDRGYYQGRPPRKGSEFFGVFLTACNETKDLQRAVGEFKIVDTQGNEFRPLLLPATNLFAYRARELPPKGCIPPEGSIASSTPIAGAMLLFELPLESLDNLPLELEVEGPPTAEHRTLRVELDI